MHHSYEHPFDLVRMRAALCKEPHFDQAKFLVDKILHKRLVINPDLFRDRQLKCIFMIREPVGAIRSMKAMHERLWGDQAHEHLEQYYIARLGQLVELASVLGDKACFLDADSLIQKPAETLSELTGFMGLAEPLSPEYRIFQGTGKTGIGDSSSNIKAGRIISSTTTPEIPISRLAEASTAYQQACAALVENCGLSIVTGNR